MRRRHADHTGEQLLGDRDARQLLAARYAVRDFPLDEVGIGEEVGEEAEAGDQRGRAELVRLVGEQLDLEHLARLGAFHVHRPGQWVAESPVGVRDVFVGALAGELPAEALLALEPDLLARLDLGDRLQIRVPAVVHQSNSPTRVAVAWHSAISSIVQMRGDPSWCSETIPLMDPFGITGVTICAASPP